MLVILSADLSRVRNVRYRDRSLRHCIEQFDVSARGRSGQAGTPAPRLTAPVATPRCSPRRSDATEFRRGLESGAPRSSIHVARPDAGGSTAASCAATRPSRFRRRLPSWFVRSRSIIISRTRSKSLRHLEVTLIAGVVKWDQTLSNSRRRAISRRLRRVIVALDWLVIWRHPAPRGSWLTAIRQADGNRRPQPQEEALRLHAHSRVLVTVTQISGANYIAQTSAARSRR